MTERAESGSVKSPDDGSCEPRHSTQRILRTIYYYQTKQKMTNAKRILVVAGSDSSGGA